MWHANHNALHTQVCRPVNHTLHAWDQGLRALQPEALSSSELVCKECLKHVTPSQAIQDVQLLLFREPNWLGRLDALTKPVTTLPVGDVHVLQNRPTDE